MSAATLMTLHNLFFYLDIMEGLRQSLRLCRFEEFRGETLRRLAAAEPDGSPGDAP
jgi:queuine/archaeosine tRNA-ribosyltransferase